MSLVLSAVLAAGCARVTGPSWEDPASPPVTLSTTTQGVSVGLVGEMGHETADQGPGVEYTVDLASARSQQFRIDALDRSRQWWVMVRITMHDSFAELAALAPGTELTSGLDAMGCSGPSLGRYTFDAHTSDVRMRVDAGTTAATRTLRFWARWGGQTVEGALEFPAT